MSFMGKDPSVSIIDIEKEIKCKTDERAQFKQSDFISGGTNNQSFVAMVTPTSFLEVVRQDILKDIGNEKGHYKPKDIYDFPKSIESAKNLANRMCKGEEISMPWLIVDECTPYVSEMQSEGEPKIRLKLDTCELGGHEGRHRAMVSEILGIKEIPVRLHIRPLKNWHDTPRTTIKQRQDILDSLGIKGRALEEGAT